MGSEISSSRKKKKLHANKSCRTPSEDSFLHNKITVRHIDWRVCDCDEVGTFLQKFGDVVSVRQLPQKKPAAALVTFADEESLSKALQAPTEELKFKNRFLFVEQASIKDIATVAGGYISINSLPLEMLDYIFTFLTIQDRIQMERVCKMWRMIGTGKLWTGPKYFFFDDFRWEKSSLPGVWHLTDKIFCAVLHRCGPIVIGVKISNDSCQVSVTSKALEIISYFCPNLTEIDLVFLEHRMSRDCLSKLGEGCRKLKVARLVYDGEKGLLFHSFLKNCQELESLSLSGERLCPKANDFEVMNKNLKVLHMNCYKRLDVDVLNKLMGSCNILQEMGLGDLDRYRLVPAEVLLKVVLCYCNTIKVLAISFSSTATMNHFGTLLSEFHQLQEFYVKCRKNVKFEVNRAGCFNVTSNRIRVFHAQGDGGGINERFVNLGENSIKRLLDRNDGIEKLHLVACCKICPNILNLCCKYDRTLKELELFGGSKTCRERNWCRLLAVLHNLQTLKLPFTKEVNDEVAITISQSCLKLQILGLAGTSVTDVGLRAISLLPLLTNLNISGVKEISDRGITRLAVQGRLEVLNISKWVVHRGGANVTDSSCCLFARCCPKFRFFAAENVLGISNTLVKAFYESIQNGYLKHYVKLSVQYTSVTWRCKKHDRLIVLV